MNPAIQARDWLLLPNILSILRIFFIPVCILALENKSISWVLLSIGFLFLTDFLDGWIARKWDQTTLLGSILDPVADKLVALFLFFYYYTKGDVPLLYLSLVFVRDISQLSAVPVLLFWKKIFFKVKPKLIPKWGTALKFIILTLFMIADLLPEWKGSPELWNGGLAFFFVVSGFIEIYILFTFLPRFYEIYTGKHDTFE